MISTAFALFFALLAAAGAFVAGRNADRAGRNADRADRIADDLSREVKSVKQFKIDVAALEARLASLAGRVYSVTASRSKTPPAPLEGEVVSDDEVDAELAATLALQRTAPPARKS